MSDSLNLDAARDWIASCVGCDTGTSTCTCPEGDFRSVMGDLIAEVERLNLLVVAVQGANERWIEVNDDLDWVVSTTIRALRERGFVS